MTAPRPEPRWHHADVVLHDFAIVTWDVDPEVLAAHLPDGITPDVHGDRALVSMVGFRDHRFHFRFAPFARVSCGQVNYRAYVRRGDERGVWFFGFSFDSRLAVIPRVLWKMPWHRTEVDVGAHWSGGACTRWHLHGRGDWGAADIELVGTGGPAVPPPGFADAAHAAPIVFDPFVGWYRRSDGSGVGRYSVWHEPLQLQHAEVVVARSSVFEALGLISSEQAPCHAGVRRQIRFDVHTPPTRV